MLEGPARRLADASLAIIAGADELYTMAQVDELLTSLQPALRASDADREAARSWLHTQQILSMEKGIAVSLPHERWLHRRKNEIDKYYWERYRKLLLSQGWGPSVIRTMDATVDEILDLAGDPKRSGSWARRGLVVGEVQSGKTAAYTALTNKAADAGFMLIVLLAGTLSSLRYQTQLRLDEGFIGYDSAERAAGQTQPAKPVGVGRFDLTRIPNAYTSRLSDFDIKTAQVRFRLNNLREPVLLVVKKNKLILDNLYTYLRGQQPTSGANLAFPLLFIDDEADNASINTRKEDDPRGINLAIRKILGLFDRASYIGFTATPFANVFITPDTENEEAGSDIFPRDFIYALESPSNYVGPRRIFIDEPDEFIREVNDGELAFPAKHRKDLEVACLPDSLIEALRAFILTNAIRDIRGQKTAHRSMLVNVSWANAVQDQVEELLSDELEAYKKAIASFSLLSPDTAAAQSVKIRLLNSTFLAEFVSIPESWEEVQRSLYESAAGIEVRSINMRSKKKLDYDANKMNGLRVIAVGGNALSRGLTLEGLSTSYILRNSEAYDTLMQMGRWFGYRPNYEDLCRLYMTSDAAGWYEHITKASEELRLELRRMFERNSVPAEFGLRVRSHPDKLIVTARNKMRSAAEMIDGTVSVSGRRIEATKLPIAPGTLEKNKAALLELFQALNRPPDEGDISSQRTKLWREVSTAVVARFLAKFVVYNLDFQSGQIANYLFDSSDPKLNKFDIALVSGHGDKRSLQVGTSLINVAAVVRGVWHRETYLEIDRRRLGSGNDEQIGLSLTQLESARANIHSAKAHSASDDTKQGFYFREQRQRPMLFVYVIRPTAPSERKRFFEPAVDLLASIALSFPSELSDSGKPVIYQANRVYQQMLKLVEAETDEDEATLENAPFAVS